MSTESPAETVRRAASLLREHIAALRDEMDHNPYWTEHDTDRVDVAYTCGIEDAVGGPGGEYAGRWAPAVTLAIAEAWVHQAIDMDAANAVIKHLILAGPGPEPAVVAVDSCHTGMRADWTATWIAARAYLRETS